jgi:hypothetical protein
MVGQLEQDAQRLLRQARCPPVARDLARDPIYRPAIEVEFRTA